MGIVAALCGVGAACAESTGERAPRPAAKPAALAFPAELEAACERIARSGTATVLCPPVARGAAALLVVHEDLDPEPCSYVINISARPPAAGEPAHPVLGGSCEPLPLQDRRGSYAVEQPKSLRLVANPPLVSGQPPRTSRPLVLGPARVRGRPGLLLRVLPFPEGGLHGGSYALVWNERGNGYVLSLRWRSGEAGRAPSRRQVAVLQELAGQMRAVQG